LQIKIFASGESTPVIRDDFCQSESVVTVMIAPQTMLALLLPQQHVPALKHCQVQNVGHDRHEGLDLAAVIQQQL